MDKEDEEDKETMMKAALEFMITLSEAQYSTVNDVDGWAAAILRGCLEGMGTLRNDDPKEWLEADVRVARRNYVPGIDADAVVMTGHRRSHERRIRARMRAHPPPPRLHR